MVKLSLAETTRFAGSTESLKADLLDYAVVEIPGLLLQVFNNACKCVHGIERTIGFEPFYCSDVFLRFPEVLETVFIINALYITVLDLGRKIYIVCIFKSLIYITFMCRHVYRSVWSQIT